MSWYTNPDWWSAIGQWAGGIGTIAAVAIAMKQINETKKLHYDLLKPEVVLRGSVTPNYWVLTVIGTNIKQTPVFIRSIQLCRYFLPDKYNKKLAKRYSGKMVVEHIQDEHFMLSMGEFYKKKVPLDKYVEILEKAQVPIMLLSIDFIIYTGGVQKLYKLGEKKGGQISLNWEFIYKEYYRKYQDIKRNTATIGDRGEINENQ